MKIVDLHVDSAVVQKVDAAQSSKPGTDSNSIKKKKMKERLFILFGGGKVLIEKGHRSFES